MIGCLHLAFLIAALTFGIYGFWVGIAIKKWEVKHTHFVY